MYGLVNRAIQDMVCHHYSMETWETIKKKAEVTIDAFVSMDSYPDDVTHRLVMAASQVLELSPQEILRAFGEHWVLYTAQEGYGEMMDMAGEDLPEFLQNLDQLHARVGVSFPQLQPPSFHCTEVSSTSLNLHYRSHRRGLAPMVMGLLQGLSHRFAAAIEVIQVQKREEGADHDEFLVHYHSDE